MAIAVSDVDGTLMWRETLDVTDGEAKADMTFVVSLPVLHEEGDVLNVNARARYLPKTCVRWLAASARIALVTSLLEELAPQTGAKLADLVGLLTLIWPQGTASSADTLLAGCVLLGGVGWCLLDNGLGWLCASVNGTSG